VRDERSNSRLAWKTPGGLLRKESLDQTKRMWDELRVVKDEADFKNL
jgi:hypothetical protein